MIENKRYIPKTSLKVNDVIYYKDEGYPETKPIFQIAIVISTVINGEIFIKELWNEKNIKLHDETGLQYYHDVYHNFGQIEFNSLEVLKEEYPKYFVCQNTRMNTQIMNYIFLLMR